MPERGHRFNPYKLLLDPYARGIAGAAATGRTRTSAIASTAVVRTCPTTRATTRAGRPRARSSIPRFTWGDDRPPRIPLQETRHLRGARQGLDTPASRTCPQELRGTYAGLAHAPVHRSLARASASPPSSCCRCTRSWTTSASSSSAFATTGATTRSGTSRPTCATSATANTVAEFKTMVKRLHRAGIEVILDVVYNHTAEGNHLGPTLSLPRHRQRGVLPAASSDRRHYVDYTGMRQHAEHAAPARAAAASWTACATG